MCHLEESHVELRLRGNKRFHGCGSSWKCWIQDIQDIHILICASRHDHSGNPVRHHEKTRSIVINSEQPEVRGSFDAWKTLKVRESPKKERWKADNINIRAHFFLVFCKEYICEYK